MKEEEEEEVDEAVDWTHLWNTYKENIPISQKGEDTHHMHCLNNHTSECGMDVDLKDKAVVHYIGNRFVVIAPPLSFILFFSSEELGDILLAFQNSVVSYSCSHASLLLV
jgi:hypothetical protein